MSNVLTAAEITQLMSNARERGGHERNIRKFNESNEMYKDLAEFYPGKTPEQLKALKNQLTMKARSLELGHIKFVKVDDTQYIVVNTNLLEGDVESDEDESDEASE